MNHDSVHVGRLLKMAGPPYGRATHFLFFIPGDLAALAAGRWEHCNNCDGRPVAMSEHRAACEFAAEAVGGKAVALCAVVTAVWDADSEVPKPGPGGPRYDATVTYLAAAPLLTPRGTDPVPDGSQTLGVLLDTLLTGAVPAPCNTPDVPF